LRSVPVRMDTEHDQLTWTVHRSVQTALLICFLRAAKGMGTCSSFVAPKLCQQRRRHAQRLGAGRAAGAAPPHAGSGRLSLIEDRLAQLEVARPDQPSPIVRTAEAWIAQEAQERRLAALERRLTTVERVREARRSLSFARPTGNGNGNGSSQKDRRHG